MKCPKCGYSRTSSDTNPEWQCPSCGIAYAKFAKKEASSDAESRITASANRHIHDSTDWQPTADERKAIMEICEGFKNLAGVYFMMRQDGKPRPVRGGNELLESIVDAIYSPTTQLKTREMAESWAFKNCMPIITENERRKSLKPAATNPQQHLDPAAAALMRAIEEKRKTDPLIGAKLGAKEINQRLIKVMKNEKGVHVESLLCALGALAGYACQASLRAQALEKGMPETAAFTVIDTADGKKYFFGDPLNQVLAESQYSVWSLAAGAAQHNGCTSLPDISEIFGHVSKTVGGVEFGIPRTPDGHQPGDTPINYVKILWTKLLPTIKQFCQKPSEWPILFGLAVQEVIDMSKGVIAPDFALKIVMESAIPMSKIDLASA